MSLDVLVNALSVLVFLALVAICISGAHRLKGYAYPLAFLAVAFAILSAVCVSNILERVAGIEILDRFEEYEEILVLPCILLFSYSWTTARELEKNRAYVRELHHRVKNNLQEVESLLDLACGDTEARGSCLEASRIRIGLVGLAERLALQHGEPRLVDMGAFLSEALERTWRNLSGSENPAPWGLDCDGVRLRAESARRLGLIVAEHLMEEISARRRREGGPATGPGGSTAGGAVILKKDEGGGLLLRFSGFGPLPKGLPADLVQAMLDELGRTETSVTPASVEYRILDVEREHGFGEDPAR